MSQAFNINITTNAIDSKLNAQVTGNKNAFTVSIAIKELPNYQLYQVSVIDFRYPTVNLQDEISNRFYQLPFAGITVPQQAIVIKYCQSIVPLLQLSIAEPMIVNGLLGSLIYKAQVGSSALESDIYHIDLIKKEATIKQKVLSTIINNIQFQIVRSDNGALYPFIDDITEPPVAIVLEIIPITIPFIDKTRLPLNMR